LTSTTTAHEAWDRAWDALADRATPWKVPERAVAATLPLLAARGARRVLDLGTGLGRHAVLLAGHGLHVCAVDASRRSLQETRRAAEAAGVRVDLASASFVDLPWADAAFDYVLAWNVVYHGDRAAVQRAIHEIARVLRPGGLYQGTMLSRRHARYGAGTPVGPGAFVRDGDGDKGHPHYYGDARDLLDLHRGFEPVHLADVDHRAGDAKRSGSYHWEFVMEKVRWL
jgi:tellurite methyltransferase